MNKCCKCGREIDIMNESFLTISGGFTEVGWEKIKIVCNACEEDGYENTLS